LFDVDEDHDEQAAAAPPLESVKAKRKSRRKKGIIYYRDENGNLAVMPPTMSLWYNHYCQGKETGAALMSSFHEKFCKRFRLPYNCYQELVSMCIDESVSLDSKYFKRWRPGAAAVLDGTPAAPISLLVLYAL